MCDRSGHRRESLLKSDVLGLPCQEGPRGSALRPSLVVADPHPARPGDLEWVAELAPVRVGVLMESLRYDAEDYAWAPQLKHRQGQLEAQLPYLTHVLAPDEQDAAELNTRGSAKALWWPPMVPERFIVHPSGSPDAITGRLPRHTLWTTSALGEPTHFSKPPPLR